ncbi:hypothetical protein FF1_027558 [Malus domestica]|uniref:uncharacterized protein LOC126613763 n=1 Tax=Malus sylvestris TaxID=3752 RepID=UPI0021AC6AE5|nr:uncharacterized protein LOC126613763 [Malus sylvestris]
MAPSAPTNHHTIISKLPPKPNSKSTTAAAKQPLVCFSVAAYAKSVVKHLHSSPHNIPIEQGLTDQELASLEAAFDFTFPPDLRTILQEGLPVGPAFPNWRSSSHQQLRILLSLPSRSLLRQVSNGTLWCESWGPKRSPRHRHSDADVANQLVMKAPVLVPIYRNCYVPSRPNVAGNPVLYIDAERVRVLSYDITRFFCQEFGFVHVPAWAPRAARRIEFWSEVVGREETRGWWSGEDLAECLEEVFWRLREGGWKEEEVKEMMMMDGCGEKVRSGPHMTGDGYEEAGVEWRVKVLSMVLLRGGWTKEDVMDSLGLEGTG